jgi:molybdopterin converting factor subunit 1
MKVTVRFFALLRDQAGIDETSVELDAAGTVASVRDALARKFPSIRPTLPRVAFAVNREYVKPETRLRDGDELALIPPVSGG